VGQRDPRRDPQPGDRVLLGHEGTARLVLEVKGTEALIGGEVTWRWLGGTQRRKTPIVEWRRDLEAARIVLW
jgi:hypothetical protein